MALCVLSCWIFTCTFSFNWNNTKKSRTSRFHLKQLNFGMPYENIPYIHRAIQKTKKTFWIEIKILFSFTFIFRYYGREKIHLRNFIFILFLHRWNLSGKMEIRTRERFFPTHTFLFSFQNKHEKHREQDIEFMSPYGRLEFSTIFPYSSSLLKQSGVCVWK